MAFPHDFTESPENFGATRPQHQISFIYEHENQVIHNYNNIQQFIKNIICGFEIDISSVSRI
ncbi:MAG: hypothetical protein HOP36_01195 [Methyloglobulus sp.]|nr:hypothetical protein [Methyloglobulus sp.]